MPASKNALIRYKTIDNCLRNRYRRWTLEDLIEACSEALYEYEGIDKGISKRTIQMDLQIMRSEKLGYNAPIVIRDRKYYEYEDPDYSITHTPLSAQDMEMMSHAVAVLKQLSGFSTFVGMEDVVGRLEDHVSAIRHDKEPIIYYEKNDSLRGLQHLPMLYQAIRDKRPIHIKYQPFKAQKYKDLIFSPYVLTEHRNRWFVFGKRKGVNLLLNLALDRIITLTDADASETYISDTAFNPATYFDDMIGVTKGRYDKKMQVRFHARSEQAPYIETKPLHKSQMVLQRNEDGSIIFQIEVVLNYELERDLLAFGEGIKVLSPPKLVNHLRQRISQAASQYK